MSLLFNVCGLHWEEAKIPNCRNHLKSIHSCQVAKPGCHLGLQLGLFLQHIRRLACGLASSQYDGLAQRAIVPTESAKKQLSSLYNLALEVMQHEFCHVLLVRHHSPSQREGKQTAFWCIKSLETRNIAMAIFENCNLPQRMA